MTQVLVSASMATLNSGLLRGNFTFTHDLRSPSEPKLTVQESTTLFAPLVQGSKETMTLDPRLLQLKTFLFGRKRTRAGYGWAAEEYGGKRTRAGYGWAAEEYHKKQLSI